MANKPSPRRQNVPAARDLRRRETAAERMLWDALRDRRLAGLKFRRQHPIGPFVADFCCPDRRLIIEVDGEVHAMQQAHDADREALLHAAGYHVLRFTNQRLLADLSGVLAAIQEIAEALPQRDAFPTARTAGL